MLSITEATSLTEDQSSFKTLKPWWDVLMDYLVILMLMASIFSGTLLIYKDNMLCLPVDDDLPNASAGKNPSASSSHAPTPQPSVTGTASRTTHLTTSAMADHAKSGHPTNLDYQQYIYISRVCYQKVLPWYSKYSPYLALMHSLILMVSSNFWFKYPKTSSKIEHFLSILRKCFESPWTTKALSETACQNSEEEPRRLKACTSRILDRSTDEPISPSSSYRGEAPFAISDISSATILDKKDGEQAKALFEKIRKFRAHTEDTDLIYKVYVGQTLFKVFKFLLILGYTSWFVGAIEFKHICKPDIQNLTGYSVFFCTHNLAFILQKLLITYMVLVCIYGLVGIYTLFWIFTQSLREYSFEKVREESSFSDIPDVRNDFAFLLHMADQYDQLYSKRFAIFLSAVSENKLLEMNLNYEWTYEKLRQNVSRDANGRLELQLFMLPGLPRAVFQMTDLEVLKLELISDVKFPSKISKMTWLSELYLYHCPAKVEHVAFTFLKDHLKVLHIKFTDIDEIPLWAYSLKGLLELHLSGNLSSVNNKVIALESLKELKNLKVLTLKTNLTKIPSTVVELASHLSRLAIQNEGTKLIIMNNLKKMVNLRELELHHCELEKIPHAVFNLTHLQMLDLKLNGIQRVEDMECFHHLRRLSCLKLCHNNIAFIPATIGNIQNLEQLFLSHNRIETLPNDLFSLHKLRHLDLSDNSISVIPQAMGQLGLLHSFIVSNNKIEVLPCELFRCIRLKVLHLGNNKLSCLPSEVGELTQISSLELKGNSLEGLPLELGLCPFLKRSGLIVEDYLFDMLPSDVKERMTE
uniref:Volume-regulated anion channel subunit LRRC8D-like n=1 Tax=Geotrypetes seraphini TaxID=260995 RepID=A0A6P8PHG2_GEOSA|nr:volume-regulated anion channel subunit LRRC8D-like [Geotrypetes seraphini]XP_033780800.1 volume-regulated anion channel subunit LRRC8D-like [Geotrypetes seraphini]